MPYIRIKAYPKDQATKQKVVEAIRQVFIDHWGCPPEAISISLEEIAPQDWQQQVEQAEIEPARDHMMILHGETTYQPALRDT